MAKPRFSGAERVASASIFCAFALPKMSNHELAGAFNKYRKANKNLNAGMTAIGPYTPQCAYRLFSTMHHPVKQSAMIRILYRKWLDSWAPVQEW